MPPVSNALVIRTLEHAPESAAPEALAASRLLDSSRVEIMVYQDRLQRFLDSYRTLARVAVAYVLAHELAHAMQGVPRHSESGILKAHWSEQDYQDMVFHKLVFTAADVELLHKGLGLQLSGARPQPAISTDNSSTVASGLGKSSTTGSAQTGREIMNERRIGLRAFSVLNSDFSQFVFGDISFARFTSPFS